ncbi:TIM44-like domain-containing protein [Paenochrobactrum sp. BZR 588]|uniref:TIM44-like domain-containing protein n=1 Tax=Paenochrobactrum TaxID=999488 RepID=UPI0035BC176D
MFRAASRFTQLLAIMAVGLAASLVIIDTADARRMGGGFGSRGARTHQAPAPTRTAPNNAAPVERSMTPNTGNTAQRPAAAPAAANAAKPGLFGGFGRSMLGGLMMGGLLGMLLGSGFGGMAGMFGMLLQVAIIALLAMLAMRFFASRRQPAAAGAGNAYAQPQGFGSQSFGATKSSVPNTGGSVGGRTPSVNPFGAKVDEAPVLEEKPFSVGQEELNRFEEMLTEVQTAYGREDYAALRKLSTPEAMSYLAEELGEIASSGKRNSVSDIKLLQGDVSESWSEGDKDYATVAMRYSSIDVMLDRVSGDVVEGNPDEATESTELWTFVREDGGEWQLSAIQSANE